MDEHTPDTSSKTGSLSGDRIEIPTFKNYEDSEQVLDISCLSHSGLALLKKNDPFMFYSIPGMKTQTTSDDNLDVSSLELNSKTPKKLSSPIPIRVKRRSRISYEKCFIPSFDEISEIHGPSKRHKSSNAGIEETCNDKIDISRDPAIQQEHTLPSSSGDFLLNDLYASMFKYHP